MFFFKGVKIFGSILAVKDKVAELSTEVDSEKCVAKTDLNERARIRMEKFEWDEAVAHRVWCCGPETEGSQCGCKTTKRKAKDPQSQPVVEGNNTLVAAPRKYDRFQAAEAHLPDGVVKEEVRELPRCDAGGVFGATGARLASAEDRVANKSETVGGEAQDARGVGGRNAGGGPRLEEGQGSGGSGGSGGSRGGGVLSSRSTGSGGKSFNICVARRSCARGARLPRRRVAQHRHSHELSRKKLPRALGWTRVAGSKRAAWP